MNELITVFSVIFSGIIQGGSYALLAVGLSLIYSVTKVINIPHGDLVILSSYISYYMFILFGWDPIFSVIVSVPGSAITGKLMEIGYRKVLKISEAQTLILAFGFSYLLQNAMAGSFGATYTSLIVPHYEHVIEVAGFGISAGRLLVFVIAASTLYGLNMFIRRTDLGRAMMAVHQNEIASMFMGININRLYTITFVMGCGLAGLGGSTYIFLHSVYPWQGLDVIIKCFAIMVLGGTGSMKGLMVGSCIIGVAEAIGMLYLGGMLGDVMVYAILIIVLVVKPSGLFSR